MRVSTDPKLPPGADVSRLVTRLYDLFRDHARALNWLDGRAVRSGEGDPEGAVTAPVGTLYTRTDGGAGSTLYVKESGTGNTGWAAK